MKLTMKEINSRFAITEFFKNVFPTLEDFSNKINYYLKWDYTSDECELVYNIFMLEFGNSNIAYDSRESFARHFLRTLLDCCDVFLARMRATRDLLSMDINDMITEVVNITNTAQNNNNIVDSPLEEIIPFISNQISSKTITNKGVAISRALSMYQRYLIDEFVDNFKKHFVCVYPTDNYIYKGGAHT